MVDPTAEWYATQANRRMCRTENPGSVTENEGILFEQDRADSTSGLHGGKQSPQARTDLQYVRIFGDDKSEIAIREDGSL